MLITIQGQEALIFLEVDLSFLPVFNQGLWLFGVKKLKEAANHRYTKDTEKYFLKDVPMPGQCFPTFLYKVSLPSHPSYLLTSP